MVSASRVATVSGLIATLAVSLSGAASAQLLAPQVPAGGAPAASAEPQPQPVADAGYVLGPGDVVEVRVVGRADYSSRVRVQTDGTIQLPLIGTLKATGRTGLQLADDVKAGLKKGGFFANPAVTVDIVTYSSRYVTVLGEVGSPGLVPIDRGYRVSEILARVGGVRATGADRLVIRRVTGEEQQLDVVKLATGGPADDPTINPGDKLFVPSAKIFYIYGQVAGAGTYKLDEEMTFRKAIARSGGLTPSGSEKRIKVFRNGQEIRKVGLNDPVMPGDVVVVGERFF